MAIKIRPATTKDRVLQYGTHYLQAIASISLLWCGALSSSPSTSIFSQFELRSLFPLARLPRTLKTILTFVRSQVKGGFWRRVFRSMEDAELITERNTGFKHALDVFVVQSGIIAAITMVESSTLSLIPASPKILHGRDEELKHVVSTMLYAQIHERFEPNRFFVDCATAGDRKQLIPPLAAQLGLEEPAGRKAIMKYLTATATAEAPALVVLDIIGGAWKLFELRNDVEDFLSLLADLLRRPRRVKWTRPFLPTVNLLPADAARATFLDISDVAPDDPGLDPLFALTDNMPPEWPSSRPSKGAPRSSHAGRRRARRCSARRRSMWTPPPPTPTAEIRLRPKRLPVVEPPPPELLHGRSHGGASEQLNDAALSSASASGPTFSGGGADPLFDRQLHALYHHLT
ncbi:hypothetical protein C8J57DRAFT_1706429 [Mycena rebaudengoi]|nr:hypothetical protein C8J57DRAFT_1706429 [Mycena rebaudengoi]